MRWVGLMMLDLGSNHITTIEPLCRLYLPKLQRLNLCARADIIDNNCITNYTALRRCSWPGLVYLTLRTYFYSLESNPSQTNCPACPKCN